MTEAHTEAMKEFWAAQPESGRDRRPEAAVRNLRHALESVAEQLGWTGDDEPNDWRADLSTAFDSLADLEGALEQREMGKLHVCHYCGPKNFLAHR